MRTVYIGQIAHLKKTSAISSITVDIFYSPLCKLNLCMFRWFLLFTGGGSQENILGRYVGVGVCQISSNRKISFEIYFSSCLNLVIYSKSKYFIILHQVCYLQRYEVEKKIKKNLHWFHRKLGGPCCTRFSGLWMSIFIITIEFMTSLLFFTIGLLL